MKARDPALSNWHSFLWMITWSRNLSNKDKTLKASNPTLSISTVHMCREVTSSLKPNKTTSFSMSVGKKYSKKSRKCASKCIREIKNPFCTTWKPSENPTSSGKSKMSSSSFFHTQQPSWTPFTIVKGCFITCF